MVLAVCTFCPYILFLHKCFLHFFLLQVEAYAALGKYREADTALAAAARRDLSFVETHEFRSLSTQLTAYFRTAK